jgi:hypothetical protein
MKSLNELFEESLEIFEKKIKVDKNAVMQLQVAQHRKGNKISWGEAEQMWIDQNTPEKVKKPRKAREPKGPKKPKLTPAKFKKMMKDTRSDLMSDGMDVEQVASDVAGSMMYDRDVEYFVRYQIHKNTGKDMDSIPKWQVQEYIADHIYG